MVAFTFSMPGGIPGDLQRAESGFTTEPAPIDYASPPTAYGIPVVVDATNLGVRGMINTDTVAYGVLVRPFPLQAATASGFSGAVALGGGSVPPTKGVADVLKRGYITVTTQGTPVKGGTVYIWTAASSAPHVQGGFEASSSGGNTITAPAYFMGAADANGNVEIAWNI